MFGLSGIKLIAIGIVTVVLISLGGTLIYQYNSGQAAKAQLAQCKTNYEAVLGQISKQNQAIESLQKAQSEALVRAKAASAKARQAVAATQPERERLAALQAQFKASPPGTCPAGEAVSAVRKGLK